MIDFAEGTKEKDKVECKPTYKLLAKKLMKIYKDNLDKFLSPEDVLEKYFYYYQNDEDFMPIKVGDIKHILSMLCYRHDFLREDKKLKYNTNKQKKVLYTEVVALFKKEQKSLDFHSAYTLYKKNSNALNLPRVTFANSLQYLCEKGCLKAMGEKYHKKYIYIDDSKINNRLEEKHSIEEIEKIVNNKDLTFNDACKALNSTLGKFTSTLRRKGIKWENRKKRYVRDLKTGQLWTSLTDCAKYFGVSKQCVNQSINKSTRVKGHYLEYAEKQ